MQDLRLAVRALYASPVVTVVVTLSLALGIGANTAIFSLVNSLLLRSLPVADPGRLALVSTSSPDRQQFSYATFEQIRGHREIFDSALTYTDCCGIAILNLNGGDQPADRQFVSGDFFTTLGVSAFRGRMLTPADDTLGAPDGPVAVVSHRLWRSRLGSREDVVGARLSINHVPVTVVGVMPPNFFGVEVGRALDVAIPHRWAAQFTSTPFDDDTIWLNVMVRLKAGLTIEEAGEALRAVQPQIRTAALPAGRTSGEFLTDPLTVEAAGVGVSRLRQRFERPLLVIFAVVALVLLVACANVGNLLLARGVARRRELGVRLALGASRWRLVRPLFLEGVLLSVIGAAIGLALVPLASQLLLGLLSTSRDPVALGVGFDWRVLAFTTGATMLTALIFGFAPAFRATRVAPAETMNGQVRGSVGDSFAALFNSLIVVQVVLSLMLVVVAGLFVQTLHRLGRVSLGFDPDRVTVATVHAPTVPAEDRAKLFVQLVQAAAGVPGVAAAGGAMNPPLIGGLRGDLVVSAPGTAAPPDAQRIPQVNTVTPGWMSAYGTTILAGRDFGEQDTLATAPVMLVNDAFVRRFAPERDVVGTTFAVAMRIPPAADFPMGAKTIVGVVADTVFRSIREATGPAIYLPLSQWQWPLLQYNIYIGVRSPTGSQASVARNVEAAFRRVSGDVALTFEPLAQQVDESLSADRVLAVLSGAFGVVALLLAGLGLYGVTAYAVARRASEIGVRMALGATRSSVIKMVLTRVALLVGIGVLAGTGVSIWASTLIGSLLYGLEARDPVTLIGAAAVLSTVGALAGWLPAWHASRMDPARALRES